jgi:hypothetical protein
MDEKIIVLIIPSNSLLLPKTAFDKGNQFQPKRQFSRSNCQLRKVFWHQEKQSAELYFNPEIVIKSYIKLFIIYNLKKHCLLTLNIH